MSLLSLRLAVMWVVAFGVAWPWYSSNWPKMLAHGARSLSCCDYPTIHSFLANVSAGPGVFLFCMAVWGLVLLARTLVSGELSERERLTWALLLIMAGVTLAVTTISTPKMTRYSVTWLPAFAAGAAFAPTVYFQRTRWALRWLLGVALLSFVLFLHNSFEILPAPSVRVGDLRLLDSRFPLNGPDWFDDNHPVDRRNLRFDEAAERIATDSRAWLEPGQRATVRLSFKGLAANHDYLNLRSNLRGEPVSYLWWYGTVTTGPKAPDYILSCKGCENLYPGTQSKDFYPDIEEDVATGELQYTLVSRLEGPEQVRILIFREKGLL